MARLPQYEKPKKGIGLGYRGAKRTIAYQIGEEIEKYDIGDKIFIDAFGGGGSMSCEFLMRDWKVRYNDLDTHIKNAFEHIICNDVDLPSLVLSREEFFKVRDKKDKTPIDELCLIVNSYGNNRKDFLYSIEKSDVTLRYTKRILEENPNGFIDYKQNDIWKEYLEHDDGIKKANQLLQLGQLTQLYLFSTLPKDKDIIFDNMCYKDFIIKIEIQRLYFSVTLHTLELQE